MKKYLFFSILFVFVASCTKEIIDKNPELAIEDQKFKSLKRYKYQPTIFDITKPTQSTPEGIVNTKKQNTTTFLRDSIWINGLGKTSFYESTEIPAVLPETRMKLFLGAIIRGDQAVDVDNFSPMRIAAIDRNPITMYATFPTDEISREVSLPSPSQDASYIRAALLAGSGQQIQSFRYEQNQFKQIDELKKSFGANLKIGNILDVNFLDTTSAGANKTRVRAEFVQENFSVNIEPPIYEPFLKNTVDMSQFGGYDPFIVSSVTYGRKGIFILESDSSFQMVKQTLNVALTLSAEMVGVSTGSKLGDNFSVTLGARLTNEQKSVIENANIKVYIIGIDGKSTVQAVTGGLAGFAKVIAECGEFSATSPGAPLYYTLNYLSDFGTFRNPFQVNIKY